MECFALGQNCTCAKYGEGREDAKSSSTSSPTNAWMRGGVVPYPWHLPLHHHLSLPPRVGVLQQRSPANWQYQTDFGPTTSPAPSQSLNTLFNFTRWRSLSAIPSKAVSKCQHGSTTSSAWLMSILARHQQQLNESS